MCGVGGEGGCKGDSPAGVEDVGPSGAGAEEGKGPVGVVSFADGLDKG